MCMEPVWLTTHKDLLNSVYATWTLRIGPMAMVTRKVSGVTTLSLKILLVDFLSGLRNMLMMAMMMLVVMMMPRKMMMMPAMV